LVLAALYDYWNPVTGQCSPTVETLAKKTNVSTGTIKRSLSRLREAGVIRQKRGPRRINSYTIAPPEEWALRLAGSVRVAR
jgi:predicted transcriptional regulator